ncbi:heme ABC transporter substrate-binding protein IsdE [Halalkalibacter sp. AB-rgal2]|uniref:heme ABC transporter substrate-binding protein IsdE n=1 Tax=Halalkalibacter sp. AB-rgal2 TaxID=3242695 RepID=UPI00359D8B6E
MKNMKWFVMIATLLMVVGCANEEPPNEEHTKSDQTMTASKEIDEQIEEVHRIVSTTVAATEIFDALEIDLVGIPTSYKDLPGRYDGVQQVGNPMNPDMELVKSLQPTDVMSVTTLQTDLEDIFEAVDLPVTFLNFQSVDEMLSEIQFIAERFNREEEATELISTIHDQFQVIEEKAQGNEEQTVLILMGVPGSYLVATEHSYIGDLVKRAGGVNIVEGEDVEYLASNTEYLQQANPDIILRAAHGMPDEVVEMFDEEFATNDIWKHFKAVQDDRVYDLEEELFPTTGNLAVIEAMDVLYDMLYPE